MTALAADRNTIKRERGAIAHHPVLTAKKIYMGSLVMRDATGYAQPGADTASMFFAGVAEEYIDNSSGASGAVKVRVSRKGVYKFGKSGTITIANLNTTVYLVDDQTVALVATTTNDIPCGKVVDVDGSDLWIEIDGFAV